MPHSSVILFLLRKLFTDIVDYIFPPTKEAIEINKSSPETFLRIQKEPVIISYNSKTTLIHLLPYKHHLVKGLIHQLKYQKNMHAAHIVYELLRIHISSTYREKTNISIVAPVPQSNKRKRERGYNQCALLTEHFAKQHNLKHAPNLLIKKRHTETQTKLSKEKRLENIYESIVMNKREIMKHNLNNKVILIVDDVFTTGATAREIVRVLENECKKVIFMTVAY